MPPLRSAKKSSKLRTRLQALVAPTAETGRDADEEGDVTVATVADDEDGDDEEPEEVRRSALRAESALSLAATDPRYRGRRVSRRGLASQRGDEAGDIDEREQAAAEWGALFEAPEDDTDEALDEDMEEEEDDRGDADDMDQQSEEEQDEGDQDHSDEDAPKVLRDRGEEVERGRAVQAQLEVQDRLLELRIQLQKVATLANRLPQPDMWPQFVKHGDDSHNRAVKKAQAAMVDLLDELLAAKTRLTERNAEARRALVKRKASDDEEDEEEDIPSVPTPAKRQTLKSYSRLLAQQHDLLRPWRDDVINKWNDHTRLASVAAAATSSKSMAAFETSSLKQIELVMADKKRLVARTQVKRSAYRVLGQPDKADDDDDSHHEQEEEIFDDDDFYHQLLREFIDRKTANVGDPSQLGKHLLQLQKLRAKSKKKVDTKASKGRKTRYDIHAKLVNFMAPEPHSQWSDEAKNALFSSLFSDN